MPSNHQAVWGSLFSYICLLSLTWLFWNEISCQMWLWFDPPRLDCPLTLHFNPCSEFSVSFPPHSLSSCNMGRQHLVNWLQSNNARQKMGYFQFRQLNSYQRPSSDDWLWCSIRSHLYANICGFSPTSSLPFHLLISSLALFPIV